MIRIPRMRKLNYKGWVETATTVVKSEQFHFKAQAKE